jgi:hypothetical protein
MEMNITKIQSFSEIKVPTNSLIVLDIDETVVRYDNIDRHWWKHTFDKYYQSCGDYDTADEFCTQAWIAYISNATPKHVDRSGFFDLLYRIQTTVGCNVVMITARDKTLTDLTINHLNQLQISSRCGTVQIGDTENVTIPIYFTGGKNKASYLQRIIDSRWTQSVGQSPTVPSIRVGSIAEHDQRRFTVGRFEQTSYAQILFVDDLEQNLADVYYQNLGSLQLYQMDMLAGTE